MLDSSSPRLGIMQLFVIIVYKICLQSIPHSVRAEQHRAMAIRAKRYNEMESIARTFERERDAALDKLNSLEGKEAGLSQALATFEISAAQRDVKVKELETTNEMIARELETVQADNRSLAQRHKDGEAAQNEARLTIQKLRTDAESERKKYVIRMNISFCPRMRLHSSSLDFFSTYNLEMMINFMMFSKLWQNCRTKTTVSKRTWHQQGVILEQKKKRQRVQNLE